MQAHRIARVRLRLPAAVRIEWLRDLRDRCVDEDIAYFFKQWGGRTAKAGGRLLDGQTYDAMPARSRHGDAGPVVALEEAPVLTLVNQRHPREVRHRSSSQV